VRQDGDRNARRLRELQASLVESRLGKAIPATRAGSNTGFCTVGNSAARPNDYTIMATSVNLAARLQSHAELGGILSLTKPRP